jgi:hypothetical protein
VTRADLTASILRRTAADAPGEPAVYAMAQTVTKTVRVKDRLKPSTGIPPNVSRPEPSRCNGLVLGPRSADWSNSFSVLRCGNKHAGYAACSSRCLFRSQSSLNTGSASWLGLSGCTRASARDVPSRPGLRCDGDAAKPRMLATSTGIRLGRCLCQNCDPAASPATSGARPSVTICCEISTWMSMQGEKFSLNRPRNAPIFFDRGNRGWGLLG